MSTRPKFARHGWLASEVASRGKPVDTMTLSAIGRNANTCMQNIEPVFAIAFDANDDGSFVGSEYPGAHQVIDEASGQWQTLFWPIPLMKRPFVRDLVLHITALTDGHLAWIGAGSIRSPFRGVLANQISPITNAATASDYEITLPVSGGTRELVSLYWRSEQLDSTASGKGRNTDALGEGTDFFVTQTSLVWDHGGGGPSGLWNRVPSSAPADTYSGAQLSFLTESGELVSSPKTVVGVLDTPGHAVMYFRPALSMDEVNLLNTAGTWSINNGGAIRIYSITAYESMIYGS